MLSSKSTDVTGPIRRTVGGGDSLRSETRRTASGSSSDRHIQSYCPLSKLYDLVSYPQANPQCSISVFSSPRASEPHAHALDLSGRAALDAVPCLWHHPVSCKLFLCKFDDRLCQYLNLLSQLQRLCPRHGLEVFQRLVHGLSAPVVEILQGRRVGRDVRAWQSLQVQPPPDAGRGRGELVSQGLAQQDALVNVVAEEFHGKVARNAVLVLQQPHGVFW
mmetsp:Transcript_13379/g.46660  ORF Transcript_13379/g.46660 Transcript_13379/m.46660 type:complete len:219 (+) Transcript_13379:947-1603(+)